MDVELLAGLIREYTSGYPFLVSRICQLLDEEISVKKEYGGKKSAWTKKGFLEAVRILLSEKICCLSRCVKTGKLSGIE